MRIESKLVKFSITLILVLIHAVAHPRPFLTGELELVDFMITRGDVTVEKADLAFVESTAIIEEVSNNVVKITVDAEMQKEVNGNRVSDLRFDIYEVIWENENQGQLVNKDPKFSGDLSVFEINGDQLIIMSRIARHKSIEVHVYELTNNKHLP
jgi:hypothetical protein